MPQVEVTMRSFTRSSGFAKITPRAPNRSNHVCSHDAPPRHRAPVPYGGAGGAHRPHPGEGRGWFATHEAAARWVREQAGM